MPDTEAPPSDATPPERSRIYTPLPAVLLLDARDELPRLADATAAVRRFLLELAMERYGNATAAASALGLDRTSFGRALVGAGLPPNPRGRPRGRTAPAAPGEGGDADV